MLKGGNLRFKQFLGVYNIAPNAPIDTKYKTRAVDYYRNLVLYLSN